jgi:protocatechuate 3,4-dioxygenase beta subunit
MSPATPMSQQNMETDENGAFTFTDVAAGKYMAMWYDVRGGNGTPSTPVSVEVTMGRTAELTLGPRKATDGGMTVSGVITRNDKPLTGGMLSFMQMPSEKANMFEMMGAYRQPIQAEVASNGTFTVTGVSTGLHCYFYSGAPSEEGDDEEPPPMPFGSSGNLAFEAGKTNIVINIGGLTVTGVVSGPDGKPVSEAYVMMMPPGKKSIMTQMQVKYGVTDAAGKYKIEDIQPGSYDISARHQEFGTTALPKTTVSAAANSFDIKLGGGVTMSGRITDDTGKALQGATVFAVPDGVEVDEMMEGGYGASDETGDFTLEPPLSPGKYRIFVMQAGRAVEASVITLPAATNLNAALAVGGDISVTVMEKGKPVEGRNIHVRTDKGVEVLRLRNAGMLDMTPMGRCSISATDQQGKTTIRGLRPGRYKVTADNSKASVTVEVRQLATAEVTLNL